MDLYFEWDSNKNERNIRVHGVSFQLAAFVFYDEYHIVIYDEKHSNEEDRYIAIGLVKEVLYVVFTEREDKIRIISARRATEKERRLYNDRNIYY